MNGRIDLSSFVLWASVLLLVMVAGILWWRRRRATASRPPLPALPESGADVAFLDSSHILHRPVDIGAAGGRPGAPKG